MTVTDEETQHQVELDFSTPSPPPASPLQPDPGTQQIVDEVFRDQIRESFKRTKTNISIQKTPKIGREKSQVSRNRPVTLEETKREVKNGIRKSQSAQLVRQRVHFNSFSDSDEEDLDVGVQPMTDRLSCNFVDCIGKEIAMHSVLRSGKI